MKMKRFQLLLICFALFGVSHLPAQTTVHSITHGGLTRSYRLYLPANYTGQVAVPLVFNLHGYTSTAQQQEFYSEMNAVADTAGFILCYPDGVNNAWNSGFTLPYNGGVDDVGFISTLIDLLATQYNVDLARVYSCGMSNGGFMSFRLACDLESRIAAIASVTGSMSPIQTTNCNLARPVPVMQVHGTSDATVPYLGAAGMHPIDSVLNFWRNQNACLSAPAVTNLPDLVFDGTTVTSYHNTGCGDSTEVLHYKVINGGHTWPGAIAIPNLGLTNQDINGSVEIWKFFYRFTHPAPLAVSMKESLNGSPQIFPNPGTHGFELKNILSGTHLEIYSTDGRLMYEQEESGSVATVSTNHWPTGIYWIVLNHGETRLTLKWAKLNP